MKTIAARLSLQTPPAIFRKTSQTDLTSLRSRQLAMIVQSEARRRLRTGKRD